MQALNSELRDLSLYALEVEAKLKAGKWSEVEPICKNMTVLIDQILQMYRTELKTERSFRLGMMRYQISTLIKDLPLKPCGLSQSYPIIDAFAKNKFDELYPRSPQLSPANSRNADHSLNYPKSSAPNSPKSIAMNEARSPYTSRIATMARTLPPSSPQAPNFTPDNSPKVLQASNGTPSPKLKSRQKDETASTSNKRVVIPEANKSPNFRNRKKTLTQSFFNKINNFTIKDENSSG